MTQKSAMEEELVRTKDELSIIRQQQLEASVTETNTCETQTEDDDEIIELREQLQKSAEALNSKQNEADLLQQQLQTQLSEIDSLQHALTSMVFSHFVHIRLEFPHFLLSFKIFDSLGNICGLESPGTCIQCNVGKFVC